MKRKKGWKKDEDRMKAMMLFLIDLNRFDENWEDIYVGLSIQITYIYIYIYINGCCRSKERIRINFEIKKKLLVKPKTTPTPIHTHTHNYKHIKYQRWIKQTKENTLQERGRTTPIQTSLTNQRSFKLETRVSSSLIEYPINKALCHICSPMKATSWKHTYITSM